jgi:hypothetical protein
VIGVKIKKLPVGVENFKNFFEEDFYYIDKTEFVADLLDNIGKVNLFTRPRRFGKSLNMSMLKNFFEIGCDKTIFDGLKISKETKLCDKYMGAFPVISITLKGVSGTDFASAKEALKYIVGMEARRFFDICESPKLNAEERESFKALVKTNEYGEFTMSDVALQNSLNILSAFLKNYYDSKVIILIDEYDVPLDKAFQYGYYDEMVTLIRAILGNALKTNDNLQFAVLTGCLRISKESIFTGLNNFNVHTVSDVQYDEYFGFTDDEVRELLEYYGLQDRYGIVKEWYNGYRFGNTSVYCPWDVINYCAKARFDRDAMPEDYWSNTSGNELVRRLIKRADQGTKDDIERLIAGETIVKEIKQELTYREVDGSIDNLWSVLYTTGYLTLRERPVSNEYRLAIPNREIRNLFVSQIREWFKESISDNGAQVEKFCNAFLEGNPELIEELLDEYLWNTISIRDNAVKNGMKENFYHGILLGLLGYKQDWKTKSNVESGEGYSDISILTPKRVGIVIEVKYADDGDMEKACMDALRQIEDKKYSAYLINEGMKKVIKYGIAFYKKYCKVVKK